MIGFLWAMALAGATIPYSAADEAAARAWIAKAGHRFDPSAYGDADLAPIVARLAGAKVIGIGEATHGTHQDEAFKAELIEALVRAGKIDALAIECNRAAGTGFDRYVTTGVGDPAALIRSPSFFSIWRNDAFAGLLLWLRAWNQTAATPIHVYGVDNQDTGVDAGYALDVLARYDGTQAARLRAALAPVVTGPDGKPVFLYYWVSNADGASVRAVIAGATALRDAFAAPAAALRADPDFAEAAYAARTALQGLIEFEHEFAGEDPATRTTEYYARRDTYMGENLLARIGAGRAALWAQNSHVASAIDPVYVDQGYRTLGMVLKAALGPRYRTVGFTWSRATVHVVALPAKAPSPSAAARRYSDVPVINDRPGDFGHVFSALGGDGWWIDLAVRPRTPALDRWGQRSLYHGLIGWRVDPARFQTDGKPDNAPDRGYDLMVWFRNMTPARMWPMPATTP